MLTPASQAKSNVASTRRPSLLSRPILDPLAYRRSELRQAFPQDAHSCHARAIAAFAAAIVVMVQGDEPMITSEMIENALIHSDRIRRLRT